MLIILLPHLPCSPPPSSASNHQCASLSCLIGAAHSLSLIPKCVYRRESVCIHRLQNPPLPMHPKLLAALPRPSLSPNHSSTLWPPSIQSHSPSLPISQHLMSHLHLVNHHHCPHCNRRGTMWAIYRPHRPIFSISTLRITSFNFTTSTGDPTPHLSSQLSIFIYARNPNKQLIFFYDPFSVAASSSGARLGNGSIPSFVHPTKNTTSLRATLSTVGFMVLNRDSAWRIQSEGEQEPVPMEIRIESKVRVKLGSMKTKKVWFKVFRNGIATPVPGRNFTIVPFLGDNTKCNVDFCI